MFNLPTNARTHRKEKARAKAKGAKGHAKEAGEGKETEGARGCHLQKHVGTADNCHYKVCLEHHLHNVMQKLDVSWILP